MKKTIAAAALLVSSASALAIAPPPNGIRPVQPPKRTICLQVVGHMRDGSKSVGTCDMIEENQRFDSQLMANGCARGQVAMRTTNFELDIPMCHHFVQL